MPSLKVKPRAASGHVHQVTPESAGWTYVGFDLHRLEAGEDGGPREDPKGGFRSFEVPMEETKVRLRAESFADHYSQARLFFRSQTEIEQAHLASALVFVYTSGWCLGRLVALVTTSRWR